MKKSVIIAAVCMFLAAGSSNVFAQRNNRMQGNQKSDCMLSQEQKEQMKTVQLKYAQQSLDIRNELNELKAHQKTLVSSLNPKQTEVFANIDKMSALKEKLNLIRTDKRLEMHSFLSEEQLAMADARPNFGRRMGQGKGQGKGAGQAMNRGRKMGRQMGRNAQAGCQCKAGMKAGQGYGNQGKGNLLNLSDEQKSKMKELRVAHMTDTKDLRDEMQEIKLQQKHMMTSAMPDLAKIKANVSRISDIENTLAKKRFEHQMQVRKILDEDQLVLFLSRPGRGKDFHRGRGAF